MKTKIKKEILDHPYYQRALAIKKALGGTSRRNYTTEYIINFMEEWEAATKKLKGEK